MIIEVNTKLFGAAEKINSNQLLFLSLLLDRNQKSNQDVRMLVSQMQDDEIAYLLEQNLVESIERPHGIHYLPTEKLKDFIKPDKDYFDLFFNMYPVYVTRPDGTKSYLRTNVNKCKVMYKNIVNNSELMAIHINDCLKFEIEKKTKVGKIGYMKTMWRWLVDHTWEESEQEMLDNQQTDAYGQDII